MGNIPYWKNYENLYNYGTFTATSEKNGKTFGLNREPNDI